MISVPIIIERIASILDAEGSDRYTFEQDYKPAINSSVEWLQAVFNKAFGERKLSEEDLSELIRTVVFQTNQFSRINIDLSPLGHSLWSLMRINPEAVVYPESTPTVSVNPAQSVLRTDLSYVKSIYSAKRSTLEKWEENVNNIFEAGNERILNSFKNYAYLNDVNYSSSGYIPGGSEIEIRPEIKNTFVGVTYLKYPTPIQLESDSIEFPESLINLVVQKALNFISMKQGDNTNLYAVTSRDIQTLVQLMV